MNNELHKTILAEKLDEVGRKNYRADFDRWISKGEPITAILSKSEYTEAALLAMEKLTKFYEWISCMGWLYGIAENKWYHPHDEINKTTEELYQIYKEEMKGV